MDNDTRTLLNLTDPHLNFPHHWLKYKVIKNVRVAQISCTLSYTPRACPNCGVINRGQILKYGFYQAKHKYVKGGFKLSFYGGLKMYDLGGLGIDRCQAI